MALAQTLRSKTGFAFRRQRIIGPTIGDFACAKVRLAIEVDGAYHEPRERPDAHRDGLLTALGWHVLRIEEHHVFDYLDHVVDRIVTAASALRR